VKKRAATISGLLMMATALSGCMSSAGPREGAGTVIGGGLGAVTGGLVGGALGGSTGAVVGAVTGGVLGGVTGNAIGRDLDERDRQLAMDAEMAAFESGQRRPWRGARGVYGYVEPGPEFVEARGTCRNFSHRIFVNGRPATTTGLACLRPDGVWQIVG
jgi:surface antigen